MALTTREDTKTAAPAAAAGAPPAGDAIKDPLLAYNDTPEAKDAAKRIMESGGFGGGKEESKEKEEETDERSFSQKITDGLKAQMGARQ